MAVASDLPDLENRKEYQDARNSVLVRLPGQAARRPDQQPEPRARPLRGHLARTCATRSSRSRTSASTRTRASTCAASAARSCRTSLSRKAAQGGSTIAQQFVKNALRAQSDRTVFQKLREAALAYHLTRKWSKSKILTEYLNSIYFGNGAYGVESAARTYFGNQPDHQDCGTRERTCASRSSSPTRPRCIAGVVANPTAYDPVAHPQAALARRNLVLKDMLEQGLLPRARVPRRPHRGAARADRHQAARRVRTQAPYFTTWVRQQLVDRFGARKAFEGGLKVQDDARPRPPEGRRAGGQHVPRQPGGPDGRARGDRQRDRRGARDGRRARLRRRARSTSPPRASASRARRSSRSSSPRR